MWTRLLAGLILGLMLCTGDSAHGFDQISRNQSPAGELSGAEIELCLKVYDRFAGRMDTLLGSEKPQQSDGDMDFWAALNKVGEIIDRAEREACQEHGMEHSRYRAVFRRLLAVQAYVMYSDVLRELNSEIQRLDDMSEEDLQAEAERSYGELEEWFEGLQEGLHDARKKSEEEKQLYLERIERENEESEEYNRNLSPGPAMKKLRNEIADEQAKLQDPRYATMREGIERNIDKMSEVLTRLEIKDSRRKKKEKKPDPSVIASFDAPVGNAEKQIASYDSIVMQPARDLRSSDEWLETVRDANEKKLREKRDTVRRLEKFLSRPRLRQAAADLQIVDQVVDREKIMSLSPSMEDDTPQLP
jgi:hypothetical protein